MIASMWVSRPLSQHPINSPDPAVRARFTELGLDVASLQQQTPEGLTTFQKAEIEKWWPIIKAANVKPE